MIYHRQQAGAAGETMAVQYLQRHGFVIVARNWRTRFGEIDIIARQERALYFFEVKWRRSLRFGHPYAAVTPGKRRKIQLAARAYLSTHSQRYERLAIGVIGITGEHIECIIDIALA